MDTTALDNAMATGDLDALEKLLGEFAELEIDDNPTDDPASPPQPATPDSAETVEHTATTAATDGQAAATPTDEVPLDGGEKVVLSKDGKHTIPYEVLEQSRARASALEQENQQLRAIQAERDKLQALLDKHDIDVNADDLENLTDEALAEIAEDFPLVGKGFNRLFAELNQLKQSVAQTAVPAPAVSEVRQIFESVPELVAWEKGDQDRLDYAIGRDKELTADPLWSAKPVRERFLEAVRRTEAAFQPVTPPPKPENKPVQPKPKDELPNSPSDIGNGVRETATRGTPEYYAGLSVAQLQAEMARMLPAEYDRLLNAIDL